MAQNLVEKIAQRYAVGLAPEAEVHAGDFLFLRPAHVMTHDNTSAVIPKFKSMGAKRVFDPKQPVFCLDHDIQNLAEDNLAKYAMIEAFAKEHGIAFFPAGRGIGHQVVVEEGFALPGQLVVASDSHSNTYGAVGALGTPVVRTDAAAIWATGQTWWQVPDVARVTLTGALRPGVTAKDVIITLAGVFAKDEVLNHCIEFAGPGVACLSVAGRMAIANMTTEWGALAGVFPCDEVTVAYLRGRLDKLDLLDGDRRGAGLRADEGAYYAKELTLDLSTVSPHVAGPNEVKHISSLPEIEAQKVKIDKAYLLSCTNARLEDFAAAAAVVGKGKVAEGVTFYIAAASSEVETQARELGYWQTLLDAGAVALPPGCGPCIGLGDGVLGPNQVGVSATNRNFKGRMGDPTSKVYLASPAVVAASALAGYVAGPAGGELGGETKASCVVNAARPSAGGAVAIMPGFPEVLEGELLFVDKDNLNTDGIYGKEFTYKEGLTPEQMAAAAMANYDPEFQNLAREGDLLVGGYNFGSGSSREQAATALKYRGIRMVLAGSYSQTYKRNAFNNGFIVVECPELLETLRAQFGGQKPTVRTGIAAKVDFVRSELTANGKTYRFAALGEVAQELVVKGGFEAVIAEKLAKLG